MKLFSYVVARDYGFAPNPFFGYCTLATCKPKIRQEAQVGDSVAGSGSKRFGLHANLVFVMKVSEVLSYDQYWEDSRFWVKRPNLYGSVKQAFGDNIYHRDPRTNKWIQENSHHSFSNGKPNPSNIRHDTQAARVLIASEFAYWGGHGPKIPAEFRRPKGLDVRAVRGHKCNFPDEFAREFISWFQGLGAKGYISEPREFPRI